MIKKDFFLLGAVKIYLNQSRKSGIYVTCNRSSKYYRRMLTILKMCIKKMIKKH